VPNGTQSASDVERMIAINREQGQFYDSISVEDDKAEQTGYATHDKANVLTRIWASLRYRQQAAFTESGLEQQKEAFHQLWLDKKAGGEFLELGCFRGTRSSWPLIKGSGRYLGIDLSAKAIEALNRKIAEAGLDGNARGIALDFLTLGEDKKYDILFAHGVLHHFENPDPLFRKISNLLKPDGILLLTEPSQINPIYGAIRALYRPFQSDKAWEWPFTRMTVATMEKYLKPVDGFGWGRHSLLLSILTGIPVLSIITKPLYLAAVKRETSQPWSNNVWSNSTITAVYQLK
jgi:SAM-dependent methyltransferase